MLAKEQRFFERFVFFFGGEFAYPNPVIDSEEKLDPWLDKIEDCSVIGLDTEADSLYSYPERLCLLQLAIAEDLILIDPLSGLNLQPLWRRLNKAEIVIHAADYDLRLLAGHCGFVPSRVFDTMRAAQFLGFRELALQRLVSHFFQTRLEKGARKSNWGKRPLTPKMREYALNDVRYLLPLREVLKNRLREPDRLDWLFQSCARLGEEAAKSAAASNGDGWRIKGSKGFEPRELACLKMLWDWREREAIGANKPPFFILSHKLLLQVVRLAADGKKWEACLPRWVSGRRRRGMRNCLQAAMQLPPENWPERKVVHRTSMSESEKDRAQELKTLRDAQAELLGIDPTLIASKAALNDLAQDWESHAPLLMDWQRKIIETWPASLSKSAVSTLPQPLFTGSGSLPAGRKTTNEKVF